MTDIDSTMAFVLALSVLSFVLLYTASYFSSGTGLLGAIELRKSSSFLTTQLFQTFDNSLLDTGKKIQILFKESQNRNHQETLQISIEPIISKIHVYDKFLNEIPSTTQISGNKIIVTFTLTFSSGEEKRIDVFYFGGKTSNIEYLSGGTGISASILSEKEVRLVSQDRCSKLSDYDNTRTSLGFDQQFKVNLTDCTFGPDPPDTTVILSNYPVLVEELNGLISPELARILVW